MAAAALSEAPSLDLAANRKFSSFRACGTRNVPGLRTSARRGRGKWRGWGRNVYRVRSQHDGKGMSDRSMEQLTLVTPILCKQLTNMGLVTSSQGLS